MDTNRTPAVVDDKLGYIVTLNALHNQIHNGNMYDADLADLALANNGVLEFIIQTGAGDLVHMQFRGSGGGDVNLQLYEGTTFSAAGTAVTPVNRNRASSNTSVVTVTHTPTLSADGTKLADDLVPGGTGGNATGGSADIFGEWILQASTVYMLRAINISGSTKPVFIGLDWIEPGSPVTS